RLIGSLLDKLDFANLDTASFLLGPHAPKGWSPSYKGVQPLVLKGLTSEVTEAETIILLRKFMPLLPKTQVLDENPTTRLLDNIVGLLIWVIDRFKTPEGREVASA